MKKKLTVVLVTAMLVTTIQGVVTAQRTSYWGEYQDLMMDVFQRPPRAFPDFSLTLETIMGNISRAPQWAGTEKELQDLFRNQMATELGLFDPPADWDLAVTDGEDTAVAMTRFLRQLSVNGAMLTPASQQLIIDFTRDNTALEVIEELGR